MLRFTYLLQHRVTHRLPFSALVLTHSTESLLMVGAATAATATVVYYYDDYSALSCLCRNELIDTNNYYHYHYTNTTTPHRCPS